MKRNKLKKICCPFCGRENAAVQYKDTANSTGMWAVCKNQACKRTFEIIIIDGKQIT